MRLTITSGRAVEMDVIIVHYHAAASVCEAVSALRQDASESNMLLNIVVADNGSTSQEWAALQSLGVVYLNTGWNAGYAGAVNIAFPATRSEWIVLMNEDVIVLPGCLRALQDALRRGAAVVGPEFYWDRDCRFRLPCTEERTRRNELLKVAGKRSLTKLERSRNEWRQHARRHWRSRNPMPTTALSGALLAFRRDTWNAVGPFDDEFPLYFEENDWLFRVARAGLQCLFIPGAKAIHLHNPILARTPERLQMQARSFIRFGNRYYGERFLQRLFLLSSCEGVIPDWPKAEGTAIHLDAAEACVWPLWVELTPSSSGFPAATTCITDPKTEWWSLPTMRGLDFVEGTLYLQVVDDIGRELCHYSFERKVRSSSQHRQTVAV